MKKASLASAALLGLAGLAGLAAPACGSSMSGTAPATGGTGADASTGTGQGGDGGTVLLPTGGGDGGSSTSCTGLQCDIHSCTGTAGGAAASTTISGTVYDPAGNNPLYNVVVYVPNTTPGPLTTGASCDSCASLYTGDPIAAAVTDATGKFTIKNAPDGPTIPLVIQIGKWRKQTTVPNVGACKDNPIATKLTLPASQAEGDIPSIAISTGGADSLECLLRRIGLDASEYGPGASGSGRIHIFQGSAGGGGISSAATTSPPAPLSSQALWSSVATLLPYDITILSCEGAETVDQSTTPNTAPTPLTAADQENLLQYASAGGRVFASHFHYAWFNSGPFGAENLATWTSGANAINDSSNNPYDPLVTNDFINANIVTTFADGGTFPKGTTLQTWLSTVSALNPTSGIAPGELHITGAKHNADLAGLANTPSQAWITADQNAQTELQYVPGGPDAGTAKSVAGATEYLSFNTPVDAGLDDAGEPAYCGRIVYSDLHVGAASGDYNGAGAGGIVPTGCASNPLSPQEKALEFMLFDLSSCVTPDTGSGQQPPPIPIK